MNHGTRYGYLRGKCRCDACTQANSEYKRRHKWRTQVDYPQWRRLKQWPLAPLVERYPDARVALGVEWTTWQRAVEGGLSDRQADQWACRLGIHPGSVFGWEWFARGLAPTDDLFVHGSETAEPGWRQAAMHEQREESAA